MRVYRGAKGLEAKFRVRNKAGGNIMIKEYHGFITGYLNYTLGRLKKRGWKLSQTSGSDSDVWVARTSEIHIHSDGNIKFIGSPSTWYSLIKDSELNIAQSIYNYDY